MIQLNRDLISIAKRYDLFRIIAWDIGTRNLSYCIIETDYNISKKDSNNQTKPGGRGGVQGPHWRIVGWNVFELMKKHKSNSVLIGMNIYTIFCKLRAQITKNIKTVLIESQSNIRAGMEAVVAGITVFYRCCGIEDIQRVNPKNKFKVFPNISFPKGKSGYYWRKKYLVEATINMLNKRKCYSKIKYLNSIENKKDDLCDSLNLILAFIEYKFI